MLFACFAYYFLDDIFHDCNHTYLVINNFFAKIIIKKSETKKKFPESRKSNDKKKTPKIGEHESISQFASKKEIAKQPPQPKHSWI